MQKDLNLFFLILRTIDEAFVLLDPFSHRAFIGKIFGGHEKAEIAEVFGSQSLCAGRLAHNAKT